MCSSALGGVFLTRLSPIEQVIEAIATMAMQVAQYFAVCACMMCVQGVTCGVRAHAFSLIAFRRSWTTSLATLRSQHSVLHSLHFADSSVCGCDGAPSAASSPGRPIGRSSLLVEPPYTTLYDLLSSMWRRCYRQTRSRSSACSATTANPRRMLRHLTRPGCVS